MFKKYKQAKIYLQSISVRYPDQDENDKVEVPGQKGDDLVRKLGQNEDDYERQDKMRTTGTARTRTIAGHQN